MAKIGHTEARYDDVDEVGENDIAIVGMALRVPGANGVDEFWRNLREGRESIVDYAEDQLVENGEHPDTLRKPSYVARGGALSDMKLFDRDFFGFSPKEAAVLDPQHRHFMELCWEALEDAGHTPGRFDGQIGLFGGCGMGSYFYFNVCTHRDLVDETGLFLLRHTGNDKDFLATRVSYVLDLKGPSVNIQTACSTSLVATHYACQSLLTGECDLALAGGVTILFPNEVGYVFKDGEVLSPDGHCHAFDHRAQGTVLTSGGGVVGLRRLEDAIEDGDPIYAVIKGSAVNNDGGQKVGYLAPSVDGQAAAMGEAYSLADVDPATIGLIECHGTGTYMGDPIEIAALTQAFRNQDSEGAEENQFCRIGSVKTNIGHLDTAAGVVGLMKAALALKNEEMPPTLNYEQPNPEIGFERTPFVVNDELTPWPAGQGVRRAAVNSLGVGGTNAHVVLQGFNATQPAACPTEPDRVLFQLAAKSSKALDGACRKLARHLEDDVETPLADVAYTLQKSREEFEMRRVVVAKDRSEAIELLEGLDPRRVFTHAANDSRSSLAFMFSGGGSQYAGMSRDLHATEPVFREHLDRGLAMYQEKTAVDLRALVLCEPGTESEVEAPLTGTDRQLAAIFIVEYAMVQLWKSWGIEPDIMIGHSMGENVAACVAGVITYEECMDWMILRGRIVDTTAAGGMIAVSLPADQLVPFLEGRCDVAAANSPSLSVASGAVDEIDALQKRLDDAEVDYQRVALNVAGHSRLFDPILEEFGTFIRTLNLQKPSIPFISNRTGKVITDEQALDPDYWVEHLRREVRFSDGLETLLETPGRVLLEVGPGQTLSSFARQQPTTAPINIVSSIRHKADESSDADFFLAALGRLWASGVEVELDRLYEGQARRRVRIPTYAWNHQSYFLDRIEPTVVAEGAGSPERIEDLADWGSVPTWHASAVDPRRLEEKTTWLLFMDRFGLGRRMRERLESAGHTVACVYEGDAFRKRNAFEYTLSPELGREGYNALVKDLAASGHMPSQIAHFWLATEGEHFRPGSSFFHENLQNGFWSLYFLAKALGEENLPGDVHLSVVSTGLHGLEGDDGKLYPEKATILGPALVIPRELPGVTCKSIDVTLPSKKGAKALLRRFGPGGADAMRPENLDALAETLEAEVLAPGETEVVAIRGDHRFVRRFEASPLPARSDDVGSALVEGGTYLLTGGLGGLGLTLADRLAREVPGVRLALLGRTPLPPREDWEAILSGAQGTAVEARTIRRIRAIEESGARVEVVTGDVTRLDDMRRGVDQIRDRFGPLDGIFHVAGIVSDDLIQLKADHDIERVFGPKVHGTEVIDAILEESGAKLLVLYSSTSALTAPTGQVDYVAANAFLDAFAHSRKDHPVRTVAINWGIWNEVGKAATTMFGQDEEVEETVSTAVSHPFFETRQRDSHGRTGFFKSYSPQRDWILDEHRTKAGEALFPGAGYPELARAALAEYGETGGFDIHDLYFLRPLFVPDGEIREVRVQLEPSDAGYKFGVRTRHRIEGRPCWVLAAEASLELGDADEPENLDVAEIDARCQKGRTSVNPLGHRTGQDNHVRFGERWRVLRQVLYGEGEALAYLELKDEFKTPDEEYQLHPALLDLATGYAMDLIEGYDAEESLWVPVSYGQIRVHGPLTGRVSSWVRIREDIEDKRNFASFDVTIMDAEGKVLFEAVDFTITRVENAVDFSEPLDAKTADVEFEATATLQDDDDLSPAELQLRRNLEAGILPEEGTEALLRVLDAGMGPQVAITSIGLEALRKQADDVVVESSGGGARFERPDLESEYVEPRDEIEKTLVALWEELLGVEGLGIQDSFFDLGGHSLIAVRFFTKIKKTYRVDFPISVLFEAPTIEGCAGLIRESIGTESAEAKEERAQAAVPKTRFKHLVAMDAGADAGKPPFFLVAGMFGNVLNLRHLASLVGTDRPFYGLQAAGLYGGEEPHGTFEEMAEAYIAEIRQVQPHGPYTIGGFSGGGITAFEMAHQLTAAGEEVSMLLMLDSLLPVEPEITKLDRVKVQMLRLKQGGPAYLWEWARNRVKWQWEQIQLRIGDEEPPPPSDEFHNAAIEAAFRAALPIYPMRHYAGHVHLFRPQQDHAYVLGEGRILSSEKRWVFADNGWGEWVDSIEVSEMPGDHDSMVLEPNVRVMAAKLREVLESIESPEVVD